MANAALTFQRRFRAWLLVACMLSVAPISVADNKVDEAKKDISGIQKKINQIKKKLSKSKKEQHDVTDALKQSETAISLANKALHDIRQEQKKNETLLRQLNKQSLTINEKLSKQQKRLGKLLYQRYTIGNQSYAQLILQSKNPSNISRDLKYQSYIAKAHAALIDDMQHNLDAIKQLNEKTTQALDKVAELKSQQENERAALELQKADKAKVLKQIAKEIRTQQKQISKLKRDERNLSRLVKKLSKKSTPPKKTSPKTVAKNQQTPDNRYAGRKFSTLRGKLKLPVKGEVTNRFGRKRPGGGLTWKGLFIRAKEGAPVKSVASGRIVFADWMRGFGNLVIVDHGSGYMSLYGNNQTIFKDVGEDVKGGDTIAAVGNTGGNQSNGLYYELRKKSVPFDPMKWSRLR